MNTIDERIDRSVKSSTDKSLKSWKNYIPLFPISTMEALKSCLVKKLSAQYANVATRMIFQSVNEAYALATLTGEPLLVLPVLAEEKVQQAAAWAARQSALFQTGGSIVAA